MPEIPLLSLAAKQIEFARTYTLSLLEDVQDEDWFRLSQEGGTHLAWQVGHLSMAQYMLTLFRLRGKLDSDSDLITKQFMRPFMKGTTPKPDPDAYPPIDEILATFHRVHQQVLTELQDFPEAELDSPVVEPYAVVGTRYGSLLFCASHEMMHAGQIGLLRRLLGKAPIR